MDGQQRLTTLTVILSYLNEYELINEKLQYNVRKETEEFLKEYIFKPNELKNIQNWEQFLENTSIKGKDYDYQWRKRSIPTHSEWLYPLTFDAGKGLKEA